MPFGRTVTPPNGTETTIPPNNPQGQNTKIKIEKHSYKKHTSFAIPIVLYRPQIGPPARNGKKMAEKWILAPPGTRGKNGRKMGKLPFLAHFCAIFGPIFPFFGHFSRISRWGQNPFFGHFFPISGRGPIWGLYRTIGIAIQVEMIVSL